MKITYKKKIDPKDQLVLLPLTEDLSGLPAPFQSILKNPQLKKRFLGKKGQKAEVFFSEKKYSARLLLWGLGKKPDLNSTLIRSQFALAVKELRSSELGDLTVMIDPVLKPFLQALGEGIGLGNFHIAKYKTGQDFADSEKRTISKLNLIAPNWLGADKVYVGDGLKISTAVNFVRELVNAPSNIVNVDNMAEHAVNIGKINKYKVTVLDKKQLEKLKMGALLAVNRGSEHHAKMVIMEHLPLGKKQEPVAIIGKGVVFDTGGVNIKPTAGLDWMKMDMAGAAVVLGVFSLLKELDIQQNVIGIFPLTDNAVDATALKPSDIVTSFSGKTIEIGNTDAEGRLILADAISYAVKNYSPSSIVDLATLTGACMVALGDHYAGLFGNNQKLKERIKSAALETDEEVWEMPIHDFHRQAMKGHFSDLNNIDGSGLAGASTAAAFLENFVQDTDWAHLDIAGPAKTKKSKDIDFANCATGYGVRLMISFLQSIK